MNEIIQPLRFYTAEAYRVLNRHAILNYFNFVPLIVDRKYLLPFQVDCAKTNINLSGIEVINELTTASLINYRTGAIVNLLSYLNFEFRVDDLTAPTWQYIRYYKDSALSNQPYGVYYIHLASEDGEWYSELFKMGSYANTITLEYNNSASFAGMQTSDSSFMKAIYEGRTFDAGEYSKHTEGYKDKDNFDIYSYRRFDKLRTLWIRGDSNVADLIEFVQLCSEVYLTDEVGKRSEIEIMEATPETVSRGNYLDIFVKYRIKGNSIISVNSTPSYQWFVQVPAGGTIPVGETFNDLIETFDDKIETFDQ